MPWRNNTEQIESKCYPSGGGKAVRIVGFVLIGLGILLILLCIPCWAWLAMIGALLMLVGFALIRK